MPLQASPNSRHIRLFGTSWWATKMVAQGARERMFCHVVPIGMPCTRSLACCLVDLICRIEDVSSSYIYALNCMSFSTTNAIGPLRHSCRRRADYLDFRGFG
jgi:hypothetical protein